MQVVNFILLLFLSAIVVGFTRPSSLLRFSSLPLAVIFTWKCISSSSRWPICDVMFGGYPCQFLLHHLDVAIICQWSFDHNGPAIDMARPFDRQKIPAASQTRTGKRSTVWERLKYGFDITFSSRFIETPSQIRYIAPFSKKNPAYIPSRRSFLFKAAGTILLGYLVFDTMQPTEKEIAQKYLTSRNIPLFSRLEHISSTEIFIRAVVGLSVATCAFCSINGVYSLCAFISVLLGLSAPKDWPPLFGSLYDAYSIRTSWSIFWHQMNLHKFSATSNFIVHRIFMVPSSKLMLSSYLRVIVVFFVSGVLHLCVDYSMGVSPRNSGAIRFFCTHILGILIEDAVVSVYRRFSPKQKQQQPSMIHRAIGYVWVFCFLVWSYPAYVYPVIEQTVQNQSAGSGSIVKSIIVPFFKGLAQTG